MAFEKHTTFDMDNDKRLQFLHEVRPHSPECVNDKYRPSRTEILKAINEQDEEYATVERGFVTLKYKKNAVSFWKSGKRKRRSLNGVRQRFKKSNIFTTII